MKVDIKQNNNGITHAKKAVFSLIALVNILLVVTQLQDIGAILYYTLLCLSCVLFVLSICVEVVSSIFYKIIISANVILMISILLYVIAYLNDWIELFSNPQNLREYIARAGVWGILLLFLITVLEIVVLPVPAAVTIVIGTYLYGSHVSFIVSVLGTIFGSIICFFLGRIFGKRLINWIIGEEKVSKYSNLIEQNGKFPFVLMMLFPCFPDDILCMVVGLTNMSFRFFILAISLTRPVMVAFYAYFGLGDIIPFSGWGIPVWIALISVGIGLLFVVNRIILKNKKYIKK